ncbi:MAG: GldG family protein [Pseudomonadota bacterium]
MSTVVAAIIAWQLPGSWDLSRAQRSRLSDTTLGVLERLDKPLEITAYVGPQPELRETVWALVSRYKDAYPAVKFTFVDPKHEPEQARELRVPASGAVQVRYGAANELLLRLSEHRLTSAIQRLLLRGERWIIGLSGHAERRLDGVANHDLGDFGSALENEGFRIRGLDLPTMGLIPGNTALLVIADVRAPLLEGERRAVRNYLEGGGNLLWMTDPGDPDIMRWLEEIVPARRLPGVIVDARAAQLGLDDPRLVVAGSYGEHGVTAGLDALTLFPRASALQEPNDDAAQDWTLTNLASSSSASWNETGEVRGEVARDSEAGEQPGPLVVALLAERENQRLVVTGDSDFLSNAYLGNGANLDLGLRLVRWLTHNDALLDIPAPVAPDARFELSEHREAYLALVFLVLLPLTLAVAGVTIHFARSRR